MAGLLDALSSIFSAPTRIGGGLLTGAENGLLGALTLPGDVYSGRTPVTDYSGETSKDVIDRSNTLAGMMTGGSYALAPAEANAVGMGIKGLLPAVKFDDRVFTGANHGEAYESAIRQLGYDPLGAGNPQRGANTAERRNLNGFLTPDGRFIDRAEAGALIGQNRPAMAHDLPPSEN